MPTQERGLSAPQSPLPAARAFPHAHTFPVELRLAHPRRHRRQVRLTVQRLKPETIPPEAEQETLNGELNYLKAHSGPLTRHSALLTRYRSALNPEFPWLDAELHSLKLEKKSAAVESFFLNAQYILLNRQLFFPGRRVQNTRF